MTPSATRTGRRRWVWNVAQTAAALGASTAGYLFFTYFSSPTSGGAVGTTERTIAQIWAIATVAYLAAAYLARSPIGSVLAFLAGFVLFVLLHVTEIAERSLAAGWANACDAGDAKACRGLAAYHTRGVGVEKDAAKARALEARACGLANADGCDAALDGAGEDVRAQLCGPVLERCAKREKPFCRVAFKRCGAPDEGWR